ncbi:MAG: YbjN domain-containing protein [Chloroherpetonaceae bacterium]|nr:YbjN domain-containing protein [bacterium]
MDDQNLIKTKGENKLMETPIELINATKDKVVSYLKKNFPEYQIFDNNTYTITRGSAQVLIIIRPYTESETAIEFISNLVSDAKITPEIMEFLLRKNAELHFGAFGLLFDNTIIFSYTLVGSKMDENEFATALDSVALIADYYDDEIIKMLEQ